MYEYPNAVTDLRACLAKQCKASKKLQKELQEIDKMIKIPKTLQQTTEAMAARNMKKRIDAIKKRSDAALKATEKKCGEICTAERQATKKTIKNMHDMYTTLSKVLQKN